MMWLAGCRSPEVELDEGLVSTQLEVQITLQRPEPAAVQCTSEDDPEEIFFAEDALRARAHTLRLSGLLPDTRYRCAVAAIDPSGPARAFSYQSGPAPADIAPLGLELDPALGMEGAWTLAPYGVTGFAEEAWLVVWGPDGSPRWWWATPPGVKITMEARYDAQRGEIVWGGGSHPEGRVRIVDLWQGERYAWAPPGWEGVDFHHDGKRLDDGRLMTLEGRTNRSGDRSFVGFGLRAHDPDTGEVSFDLDSQVLLDQGALELGPRADPWHANWMDWEGDTVYVSLCNARQILALDASTGLVRWQLGEGLGWTLLDEAGAPLAEEALPRCQHGLEIEGDRVLVYDNGQDSPESSVSEWRIDEETLTATRLWRWTEPGFQEDYLGDVDYLPRQRILVTRGASLGDGVGEILELDLPTGRVASRLRFDQGGFTYRGERYGGCELFSSVRACEASRARYRELAPRLVPSE